MKTTEIKKIINNIRDTNDLDYKMWRSQVYRVSNDYDNANLRYDQWKEQYELWIDEEIYELSLDMYGEPNELLKEILKWADTKHSKIVKVKKIR